MIKEIVFIAYFDYLYSVSVTRMLINNHKRLRCILC